MALRDTTRHDCRALERLLLHLCLLLRAALALWAAAASPTAAAGWKKGTAGCTFGGRLALALVRSDALQAHARALARRHQQLRSALGSDQGAAAQAGPPAIQPATERACDAVSAAAATLCTAARPLAVCGVSSSTPLRRQLQVALIRALHASNVLEHLARLRLELQQAEHQLRLRHPEEEQEVTGWLAGDLGACFDALHRVQPHTFEAVLAPWVVMGVNDSCGWALCDPHLRLVGGADGLDGTPLLLQLRSLARQPCLQLYAGWRLAAHLCQDAGAQLFGMPESLMPVRQLSEEERLEALRVAATLWAWALWAPPDASGAGGEGAAAAAQGGGASQPLPPLPYKPVHMVRLMCGALLAGGEVPEEFDVTVVWVCYRALLHHPMPLAEAEAMLRDVWRGVVANLRHGPEPPPVIAGRLLRLPLGAAAAADDGGGPAAAVASAVPPALPLSLRCALEAGLLRGLESHLRSAARTAADTVGPNGENDNLAAAFSIVDLLLRRPGVWPAVLAHAPPLQVAALVVTLRKALVVAKEVPPIHGDACMFQAIALMEQAAAAVWALAPNSGSRPNAVADACRSLQVNQWGTDDIDLCDREAARAPPSLVLLARQGGCPAPGSPASQQQRRLAVFAVSQLLPELVVLLGRDASPDAAAYLMLGSNSTNKSNKPLLFWLRVVAEECLRARWAVVAEQHEQQRQQGAPANRPAGGTAAGAGSGRAAPLHPRPSASAVFSSWRQLVCSELRLAALLLAGLDQMMMDARRRPVQPHDPLLDLLELAVAAVPEHVAEMLQPGWQGAANVMSGPAATLTQRFLQRHGRYGLWEALHDLGRAAKHGGLPPDWQPPEQLLAEAPHLRAPPSGWAPVQAPLPSPCEVADMLPLCSYPLCATLDGKSEADATLRMCARCRVARYCSPACQRAHWAAGHKAECMRGGGHG